MEITDNMKKAKELIDNSNNIVFFGGAGVSTESGVPDFRSKDGLYNQHDVRFEKYDPEYLLSHSCLIDNPNVFFEFYRQKMDARNIEPNKAHYYLAKLEREGKLKAVITQNIDGLHTKAGSKEVFEIHGTTMRNYCMKCGKHYDKDYIFDSNEQVPHCACGGVIRCDVTLYEEPLPYEETKGAIDAISKADLLIIGGTSLRVYPAASYIGYYKGDNVIVINKEHLDFTYFKNIVEINEPIGEVFSKIEKL